MIVEINLKKNYFSNSKIERLLNQLVKIFITSIFILIFAVSFSEAAKKKIKIKMKKIAFIVINMKN